MEIEPCFALFKNLKYDKLSCDGKLGEKYVFGPDQGTYN